ncbi:MAG: DUF3857 domain-containing protein [Mucilaginibacter sp.]
MKIFLLLLAMGTLCLSASAQKTTFTAANIQKPPATMPFGKVGREDLEMKVCDFEPEANAEILFDKGEVSFSSGLIFERHVRIKIFNDKGKNYGNFKIEYLGVSEIQKITSVDAETINLNGDKQEVFKADKKDFYKQHADRDYYTLTFSLPNVQAGSVLDIRYTLFSQSLYAFPNWYFQTDIPTRYSEFRASVPNYFYFKHLEHVTQPYLVNTDDIKALGNVPSLHDEPYMGAKKDNLQHIQYLPASRLDNTGGTVEFGNTWNQLAIKARNSTDFGSQLNRHLSGEGEILDQAKKIKTTEGKIAYLFDIVKNTMKWNEIDRNYTIDGTSEAWDKKAGNSTEINLILYHLLRKAGINAIPMMVSTRENGKVNPAYPNIFIFNRTVAYVPLDGDQHYILDATNKYNVYNQIPASLLNGMGFYLDEDNNKYDVLFLQNTEPVRQMVSINAEIKPDAKMIGSAHINSYGYNRKGAVEKYKTDGEKKYTEYLQDHDNSLHISKLAFENMETDTLPLLQVVDFDLNLTGSDDNYIYFNANRFAGLGKNEFLAENRQTDIDFGYNNTYIINGIFKMPAGYKMDVLPKSVTMSMPDNSIVFKRITAEEEGMISLRYSIVFKKSLYFKENYPEFHDFFKKMFEMLNEQVVLKKS